MARITKIDERKRARDTAFLKAEDEIMILLIFAVSFVACMGFLGKKLIAKKAPDVAADQENMFEELKDLQSLKINNITAQEFNNYTVGIALLFMAYLAVLYVVLGIINQIYIACGIKSYGGGVIALIYLLNYIVIMVPAADQVYFYAFFKKAVAPNLKHGALIIERINKFVKKLLIIQAVIMLIATLYIDPNGERYIGTAAVASSIIIMVMWTLTVRVELFRVGLPNFFDGMKKIMGGSC